MPEENQESVQADNSKRSDEDIKTLTGGCHCRKFEFEYECPSIEANPPVICNCSYCTIQGSVVITSKEADTGKPVKWTRGSLEETSKYVWNSKQVVWHFCSVCGVILCWTGFGSIGVNARCLDDIPQFVPESTNVKKFDGATQMPGGPPAKSATKTGGGDEAYSILSPQYKEPEAIAVSADVYPGDYVPGTKLVKHRGGCHCRKFEFEYEYPYLDVHAPTICNCSFCYNQAAVLAYGNLFHWTKGSFEETTSYNWNLKEITWHFCPECGSLLLWSLGRDVGVNARCFDEFAQVSLDKIVTRRDNGKDDIPGLPPSKRSKEQIA